MPAPNNFPEKDWGVPDNMMVDDHDVDRYRFEVKSMPTVSERELLEAEYHAADNDELFENLFALAWRAGSRRINRRPITSQPMEEIIPALTPVNTVFDTSLTKKWGTALLECAGRLALVTGIRIPTGNKKRHH